jgi:hypothetical protein
MFRGWKARTIPKRFCHIRHFVGKTLTLIDRELMNNKCSNLRVKRPSPINVENNLNSQILLLKVYQDNSTFSTLVDAHSCVTAIREF